jgi:hypothetical protein
MVFLCYTKALLTKREFERKQPVWYQCSVRIIAFFEDFFHFFHITPDRLFLYAKESYIFLIHGSPFYYPDNRRPRFV